MPAASTIPVGLQIEEVLFGIMQSTEFNRAYVPGGRIVCTFPAHIIYECFSLSMNVTEINDSYVPVQVFEIG